MTDTVEQDAMSRRYYEMVLRQNADDRKFFEEKKPGWHHGAYWDWIGDSFQIVETINSDNSLYYPD